MQLFRLLLLCPLAVIVHSFQTAPRRPLWTRQQPVVHSAVLSTLDTFFQTQPYAAAALTCGFKASTADLVAQKRDYRKRNADVETALEKTTDWKRNLAFLIYGAIYQGVAQEFIYNHLYPSFFGAGTSVAVVLSKVLFDLCVQTTLVTLPIAYLTKVSTFRRFVSMILAYHSALHSLVCLFA